MYLKKIENKIQDLVSFKSINIDSKKILLKKIISVILIMFTIELIFQTINSIIGINGYSFELKTIMSSLGNDLFNVAIYCLFTLWLFLISKLFEKKTHIFTIFRITSVARFARILVYFFSYIPFLKKYPGIYILGFLIIMFIGLLNITSKKKACWILFISSLLIPGVFFLFSIFDFLLLKSLYLFF